MKGDVKSVWRLVICLDVEASSLEEAYSIVYDKMKTLDCEEFQWESTDEAFDPDGDPIDEEELVKARLAKFDQVDNETMNSHV